MRPQVENLESSSVPASPWDSSGIGRGASIRPLSVDEETGATTALIDLPVGFTHAPIACDASQDWLLLEGEIQVGDRRLHPGAYSYYPSRLIQPSRSVLRRATVLAIFDTKPVYSTDHGNLSKPPEIIEYTDIWAIPWEDPLQVSEPSESFRSGVLIKKLRVNKTTGEQVYLAGLMAGWYMPGLEVHGYEENYTLSGDVHIGEVGGGRGYTMTPGSYMSRPANIPHGPIVTKNGNVNLVHVLSRMVINYQMHPQAERMIRTHLETYPWR